MTTTETATRHPDLALLVVVVGVLIAAVDTTIVVLALPEIQRTFRIGLSSVIWVIIGYLFVITLVSTQVGRLGDLYGRATMYELGFAVFVVGSALCALAWDERSLIGFRLLQGVGGALIAANSGAVIADTFPPNQRGRAYGFNAAGFNTGAVLGVVLGGIIVSYVSWRWIFWINVPIGIGALVTARRVLVNRTDGPRRRLDWWGVATIGLGLLGVLWAMVDLVTESMTPRVAATLLAGLVLLVVAWLVERRTTDPLLELSLFRVPTLAPSLLAAFFQSLANFSVLFLILMYLQGVRGLSPIHASLLLVPGYVIGGVVGPFAGRLTDRLGAVRPATAGLALQALTLVAYAQFHARTPLTLVATAYVVGAIGAGLFFPANNAAVMKAAPSSSFGITSGLLRTFTNVGMVFSFALAILVASATIPRHEAFAIFVGSHTLTHHEIAPFLTGLHAAFYASTSLMALAAILSASRARRTRL